MNSDTPIICLKGLDNAYDLLVDFNKKIGIYKTEDEMAATVSKFLELGNPIGIIDNGKLISYFNIYCNNTETWEAYFGNLYVLKEYRRNGYAKKLVFFAIDFAREKHFKKMVLHVAKDNIPAIRLYETIGFEYTGNSKMIGIEDCYEMFVNLGEE